MTKRVLALGFFDGVHLGHGALIRKTAEQYVAQIFQKLRDHDFDPKLMQLYVVGGGGCLIRNFGSYDKKRVTINDDICATAKGYEYLTEYYLKKREGST